ncbi:hypothetical protein ACXX82_24105 [Glaciimonas sp. GNP009]
MRRSDYDLNRDEGIFGCITTCDIAGTVQMDVIAWGDDALRTNLVATLNAPVLVAMNGDVMRFRGYQRENKTAPTYLQNWVITIIGMRPPAAK